MQYSALMDELTTSLATTIGARVRQERRVRNWTLDRLAELANVSRRMVINVEQGAVNPSVGTLLRLSDALGIGLPALVEPSAPTALRVTRRGEGAALWTSKAGGCGLLVAGTGFPDVLELWDWTLAAGDQHLSEAHVSGTKELIQVQEGQVILVAGGQSVELGVGDATGFPGDLSHSYTNAGNSSARFSLVVYEPNVGVAATRREVSRG